MECDDYNYDDEIFADNLSTYSGEGILPEYDSGSDLSDDDDTFVRRRNRVFPLQCSDSESEEDDWSDIDNPPNIEPFLGTSEVRVLPTSTENISIENITDFP
ncbi:hypothetical protein ABEB36_001874 [Hypothenemus hampei]|uniref:Uncharacterized protein n=1 Tax=Hypothenemus hampei TaxID=57062 RepID=A0ABD1FJ60_HYPHA